MQTLRSTSSGVSTYEHYRYRGHMYGGRPCRSQATTDDASAASMGER
jgi:hypothetical protein